ncbi:hypothetical protein T265_11210 [Opisthorchis viverrini]|uniref:Uncharacterized protein n=1 Tax=Opisthorchis viverrini TaxID=6198 RepID=A0A074YZU6_OPIVI|nr:hypothetical protein T265_11210 [Opisthorchis viverrini]KER20173.1 hypothetical protein T265_11210 [Opisthorchis viverrini]
MREVVTVFGNALGKTTAPMRHRRKAHETDTASEVGNGRKMLQREKPDPENYLLFSQSKEKLEIQHAIKTNTLSQYPAFPLPRSN